MSPRPLVPRRAALGALLAGPLSAACPAAASAIPALREAAAARGLVFGTEVLWRELAANPDYAALVSREAAALTPGLEAKWSTLRPGPEIFDFAPLDRLLDYAAGHAMQLRLHTLVWGPELPAWAREAIAEGGATGGAKGGAEALLTRHVATVVGHCRGRALAWDVANEITDPRWSRGPEGLTYTPWRKALGPEVIPLAFHLAHEADPAALLFLNDDLLEYEGPQQEEKRATYLRLIEGWRRRGVPIHGFGLEAHLDPARPFAEKPYRAFLAALADLGLVLHVTELDVRDQALPAALPARDRAAAETVRRYLDVALDEKAVRLVATWGLSNRFTWYNADRTMRRADGLPARPLPFDAEMAPTAMHAALLRALAGAPAR